MTDLDKLASEIYLRLTERRIASGAPADAELEEDAETAYRIAEHFVAAAGRRQTIL